ncbi:hypothetical protein [Candidatus Ichthyocystis sparus]|uniref:hypothetical protein n=1 Tax=Candidatus Ichthyocystis sparus TaxID=1561004 RepID=UPI00159ED21A|nr:hypothetical protein [Candidatus Ichthyocystis sparus]
MVNALVASDSPGRPAALLAGSNALEAYFAMVSEFPTKTIYALHSQLSSARRSIGHILAGSGLFVALENNFPEVVRSYISLLKLIPKDELVNVLVASDSSGRPAALLAGSSALEAYFAMLSEFPTKTIYTLHSQLSSARRSIEDMFAGDSGLEGKYKFLLDKIKELARSSRQDH